MTREKTAAAAIILFVPFGLWGPVVTQAHLLTMLLAVLFGTALLMPNLWLRCLGLVVSAWLFAGILFVWVGMFPDSALVTFIDGTQIILLGMLVYLFVYFVPLEFSFWANLICSFVLVQIGIAVLQFYNMDPVSRLMSNFVKVGGEMGFNTPVGTLGNPNFLAAYIAISFPFFLRRGWACALPVIAFGLYITRTSTAMAAVLVAFGWWLAGWRGACVGILGGIGAYFATGHDGIPTRVFYWIDAVKETMNAPLGILAGWGPGVSWRPDNQLHNEYVAAFFNYGLVGLALMVGYLKTLPTDNRMLFAAMLAVMVNMVGNHPLHTVPTAILIAVVAALIERHGKYGIS